MVARTEERELESFTDDLRVDATETPIEDLRETYRLAKQSFEDAMELYEDAYEEDSAAKAAESANGGEAAVSDSMESESVEEVEDGGEDESE
jgi:uncharacterized Ntn-hydrolase superfamily protein